MEKELCRKRIKTLQEFKDDMAEKLNPLCSEATMDLYKELNSAFNKVIDSEAIYLASLKESD